MLHLIFPAATLLLTVALQVPPIEWIVVGRNSDLSFACDWGGKDVQGNPETADAVEFMFREFPPLSPPAPALRVLQVRPVVIGQNDYKVSVVLTNVVDGDYALTARVRDAGANWSDESVDIKVRINSKKPPRLTNLRVVGR